MRFILLLIGLALGSGPAHAFTLDCARLLTSWSKPENAFRAFDRRANRLREASLGPSRLDRIRTRYHRSILVQTSRLLVEHEIDCSAVERVVDRNLLTLTAPRAALRLMLGRCPSEAAAFTRVTKTALQASAMSEAELEDSVLLFSSGRTPAARHLRQWLKFVVEAGRLSREQWLDVVNAGDSYVLPLTDVVKGDLGLFGFGAPETMAIAQRLARLGLSFGSIVTRTRLPNERWAELLKDLDPLQRLGYRRRKDLPLDDVEIKQFEKRIADRPPFAAHALSRLAASRMMLDLIYDPTIPMPLVFRIDRALHTHAPRIYGGPVPLVFDSVGLNRERRERALQFFGRAVIQREDVLVEKRRFAGYIEAKLRHARFSNADDVVAAFKIRNVYRPARTEPRGSAYVGEHVLEEQAVAEVYFRVLRDRLPEILALRPNAMQLRFLLETPIQFRHLFDEDDSSSRWAKWTARFFPSTFDNYRKIHERVILHAKNNLRTIADWREVALHQTRFEKRWAKLKVEAIDDLVPLGLKLGDLAGDRSLNWLVPVAWDLRHDTTMTGLADAPRLFQLVQLRAMLPQAKLTWSELELKAIEILELSTSLRIPERRRFDRRKTQIERELIQMYRLFGSDDLPGDPREVDRAIRRMREGLLTLLAIRFYDERTIVVDREQYERLLPIAAECNFQVIKINEGEKRVEIAIVGIPFTQE